MEFNSLAYAVFLGIIILLYFAPFMRQAKRQHILILAGSYFFYGSWDWRFLCLIILTTLSSYLCAIAVDRWRKKFFLVADIVLNVGVLCVFKYFNFFADNLAYFLKWFNWEVDWVFVEILLPVGISFYTFQAIGYVVDVWRRDIVPTRNLLLFSAFIAYFPQLVAGPIERASNLLPQLNRVNVWNYPRAVDGMRLILWGMFKKVAVADPCGAVSDSYFASSSSSMHIYLAAVLFTIQIYCDFSGYSDIARGTSRILGVELINNFRRPFLSTSVIEFWRRWHTSLMNWFKDYVYIPLGGSRKGLVRTVLNTMLVFTLSGLWHGAGWNFILWGVFCGLTCVIQRLLKIQPQSCSEQPLIKSMPAIAVTFSITVIGLVIFRIPAVTHSLHLIVCDVIPFSALFCLIVLTVSTLYNRLQLKFTIGRFISYRYILWIMCAFLLGAVFVRPSFTWFHLYYATAAFVLLTEAHAHNDDYVYPVAKSVCMRYFGYFILYLVIMAYGFFELPPVSGDTQFIYFQF